MFLLTACPDTKYRSALDEIQDNKMDFPDLALQHYDGISYQLSTLFRQSYYDDFVIQTNANVRIINELALFFSVESFSEDEALTAQYEFEEEVSLLDAIHDMYTSKRVNTLFNPTVSIKKTLPESVSFPGYMQVTNGSRDEYGDPTTYFMATVEIDDRFYVFQLIGKKENMGYLHDDFIDILSSIQ